MNRISVIPRAFASVLGLTACSAFGQLYSYGLGKAEFFIQEAADVQPTIPYTFAGYASCLTSAFDEAGSCVLQGPASSDLFPVSLFSNEFGQWAQFLGYYPTLAELEAAVPPGEYAYQLDGGTLGPVTAPFTALDVFKVSAADVPYVTGDTFDRFQNMDPSVDFVGTVNPFTPDPVATNPYLSVFVYQSCGGQVDFWSEVLPPSATSFTIPAGTLLPAREYAITLAAVNETVQVGAGPNASDISQYWQSATGFTFLVGYDGCLADLDGNPGVDFGDFLTFFNAYDATDSLADLNGCGGVDFGDFLLFFNAYDQGC